MMCNSRVWAVHAALQESPRRGALGVFDAPHWPTRCALCGPTGQCHDSKPLPELLGGRQSKELVIPCRVNRKKNPRVLGTHRYKARHLAENLFQCMTVFRRVTTRDDKLNVTFPGFVHIANTMKWLH